MSNADKSPFALGTIVEHTSDFKTSGPLWGEVIDPPEHFRDKPDKFTFIKVYGDDGWLKSCERTGYAHDEHARWRVKKSPSQINSEYATNNLSYWQAITGGEE